MTSQKHHLEIRRSTFFDINNKPVIIKGCSINAITDLRILFDLFWSEISRVDPTLEISFIEAIEANERVFNVADSIIKLVKLDPNVLDIQLLEALVHSYVDGEGITHKGFISEMHFKEVQRNDIKPEELQSTWEDYYYQTLTNLAEKEGSLEKAEKLFQESSQELIEGYLATHYQRLRDMAAKDPENKPAKKERYRDMFEKRFGKKKHIDNVSDTDKNQP
jgi:hypothetical protein